MKKLIIILFTTILMISCEKETIQPTIPATTTTTTTTKIKDVKELWQVDRRNGYKYKFWTKTYESDNILDIDIQERNDGEYIDACNRLKVYCPSEYFDYITIFYRYIDGKLIEAQK